MLITAPVASDHSPPGVVSTVRVVFKSIVVGPLPVSALHTELFTASATASSTIINDAVLVSGHVPPTGLTSVMMNSYVPAVKPDRSTIDPVTVTILAPVEVHVTSSNVFFRSSRSNMSPTVLHSVGGINTSTDGHVQLITDTHIVSLASSQGAIAVLVRNSNLKVSIAIPVKSTESKSLKKSKSPILSMLTQVPDAPPITCALKSSITPGARPTSSLHISTKAVTSTVGDVLGTIVVQVEPVQPAAESVTVTQYVPPPTSTK